MSFPRRRESSAMKKYYIYILASQRNGTLYIGVTNNLCRRIFEHKHVLAEGFVKKYKVKMLVYFEETENIEAAIYREKQLKHWNRKWKLRLIENNNPRWKDLSHKINMVLDPRLREDDGIYG